MEESKWINTTDRFVAFFDIMGFKDMVARNSHDKVYEKMKTISAISNDIKKTLNVSEMLKIISNRNTIRPVLFSDSFLLISNNDSDEAARLILFYSVRFIKSCLQNGIPVKGCVSHGKMSADFDKSIFFGQPLIDAYLLQEDLQVYGGILHHSFDEKSNSFSGNLKDLAKLAFIKGKVQLKNGKISHNILRWPALFSCEHEVNDCIEKLYCTVSGRPRIYVDNTLEMINLLYHDEFNKLMNPNN